MLDDSYSMGGENRNYNTKWKDLKKCVDKFIDEITNNQNCHISVIIYNSTSRIVISNAVPGKSLKSLVKFRGGGTNFGNPLMDCIQLCKKSHTKYDELILYFMSDGHSSYPKA